MPGQPWRSCASTCVPWCSGGDRRGAYRAKPVRRVYISKEDGRHALKNAIDFLFHEWNNKAAAFVSYGCAGGARAVEHLRQIMAELMVATVRAQVMFSLVDDFDQFTTSLQIRGTSRKCTGCWINSSPGVVR